ncbi:MAG: hypothetical protein LBQ74_15165 [Prevotella sp.]|nr:hypothetical protein [Prevotella sp.]
MKDVVTIFLSSPGFGGITACFILSKITKHWVLYQKPHDEGFVVLVDHACVCRQIANYAQ